MTKSKAKKGESIYIYFKVDLNKNKSIEPLNPLHTHCVALLPLLTAVRGQLLVVLLAQLLQPHVLPYALSK